MAKVMETVGGAGKAKGMGAGLALVAGAAGLAMKNRGKIQGMLRRPDQERIAHADAPANPKVEVQPDGGPVGPDAPTPLGSSDYSAA